MTEKSWLWSGTATGDASLAPVDRTAFNRWFIAAHGLDSVDQLYVLPGYLDDLLIEPVAGSSYSSLRVRPGVGIFKNFIYYNDADLYFAVDSLVSYPTTTNYRYDSLVIRLDRSAQKVSMALLRGVEGTTYPPIIPTLTQTTTEIYEIEIARVLIDSTSFLIDHGHVEVFTRYLPSSAQTVSRPTNMIQNPEFMGASNPSSFEWMNSWYQFGVGAGESAIAAPFAPQKRGWSWSIINLPITNYVYQWIPLPFKVIDGANVLTYEGAFNLLNATVKVDLQFQFYDAEASYIPEKDVILRVQGQGIHTLHRTFRVPDLAKSVKYTIIPSGTTNSFYIGQQILCPGYFSGGFRTQAGPLFSYYMPTDSSWDGDAKSTANTTINLATSFAGAVPLGTRAVVLQLSARDSGSAAGTPSVYLFDYSNAHAFGGLYLEGQPNDSVMSMQCICYIDQPYVTSLSANRGFTARVAASGAGTMDVWIEIAGIIT